MSLGLVDTYTHKQTHIHRCPQRGERKRGEGERERQREREREMEETDAETSPLF